VVYQLLQIGTGKPVICLTFSQTLQKFVRAVIPCSAYKYVAAKVPFASETSHAQFKLLWFLLAWALENTIFTENRLLPRNGN